MTHHKHDSHDAIVQYRAVMAWFLESTLPLMAQFAGRETGFTDDLAETRDELQRDPQLAFRLHALCLVRKARLHVIAVLAANQNSNLHSLAVQTRPALECAGQVVSVFRNLFIESDPGAVDQYLTSDYLQTMQRLSKGQRDLSHFLEPLEKAHPLGHLPKPKRLLHTDKVKALEQGPACYSYLSRFYHPSLDTLRGPSVLGGVSSINSPVDQLAFAINLDYLALQMLVMLAHAALPQHKEFDPEPFLSAVLTRLEEKRGATHRYGVTLDSIFPSDEL